MIYFSKDISFLMHWSRFLIRTSYSLSNNLIATLSPVFLFSASRTLKYNQEIIASVFSVILSNKVGNNSRQYLIMQGG